MKREEFIAELKQRGKTEEIIALACQVLEDFHAKRCDLADYLQSLRDYADKHIAGGENAVNKLVILFWYHDFIQKKPASTYLLTMLGTVNVLENQRQRLALLYGIDKAEAVFSEVTIPALGSDLKHYPKTISHYLTLMSAYLTKDECQKVMAGNHHEVDVKHFNEDKKLFACEPNLREFLQGKHQRLVAELQSYAESGKLWFEQHITPAVVDYVKAHQEIQTGVLEGDRVIVSKIPYNPEAWLNEQNPALKRYYACHCPFVREVLLTSETVPSLWCYCSGGYTKLFWDYLFDVDLEVELLGSVLDGTETCRFAVRLPQDYLESRFIKDSG